MRRAAAGRRANKRINTLQNNKVESREIMVQTYSRVERGRERAEARSENTRARLDERGGGEDGKQVVRKIKWTLLRERLAGRGLSMHS